MSASEGNRINAEDQGQINNSAKRKLSLSNVEDESNTNVDIGESQNSIDEEFKCAICLETMTVPYTIIPCLHTFDKDCITSWWKTHDTCPSCKKKSKSAKSAFHLRAIMDHVNKKRKSKNNGPLPSDGDREDIFPQGDGDYDDEEDEDEDDAGDIPPNVRIYAPGDGLLWPCDACTPGHPSGYTCPIPIPPPSDQEKADEAARRVPDLTPVGPPVRGNRRPPLHTFDGVGSPGIDDHVECSGCSNYIPRNFPRTIQCGHCGSFRCNNFDPRGCPLFPGIFYALRDIQLHQHNIVYLTGLFPSNIRRNRHEITRFTNFVEARNLSVDDILAEIFRTKRDQVAEDFNNQAADRDWGPNSYFCSPCVVEVTKNMLFDWWRKERQRSIESNEGLIIIKPECWYGMECRTQWTSDGHADRYNHIGYNTRDRAAQA